MTECALRSRSVAALISILLLVTGCTGEHDSTHLSKGAGSLYTALTGTWLSDCAVYPDGPGSFFQEESYFHDGAWYLITTQFENADCSGPFTESVTEGVFYLGQDVYTEDGIVARQIDWLFGNGACYSLIDYDGLSDTYVLGDFNDPFADCSTSFDRSRRMDFTIVYSRAR